MKFTPEQLLAARECNTPEEILEKAKEHGIEITLEKAQDIMNALETIDLTDEDLELVSGGGDCSSSTSGHRDGAKCPNCCSYKTTLTHDSDRNSETMYSCNNCHCSFSLTESIVAKHDVRYV